MKQRNNEYIPALKYDWLTSIYDLLMRWLLREATFKRQLLNQTQISSGYRVLDLGCGTGTLTLLTKQAHPGAEIIGLDGDPKALQIARNKATRDQLAITFDEGLAQQLPYPDHSFERVVSSLLFHHLTRENKQKVLHEALRVLRPGGELHVADWGQPKNKLMRAAFLLVQILDGFETTTDNVNGELPRLFSAAGFQDVQQRSQFGTLFGTIALYQAIKPE